MKKLVFLTILIVLVYAGLNIYKNTDLLTFNISEENIVSNNTNSPSQAIGENSESPSAANLNDLIETNLVVPAKFTTGVFGSQRKLLLPENFEISVFAAGMTKPRFFDFDENGAMYITDTNFFADKAEGGEVLVITDNDKDGVADAITTVDQNLNNPHGIVYFEGNLYVGEETQVVVYKQINPNGTFQEKEVLIPDLPTKTPFGTGSGHVTRTVEIGPDRKIYVSIGSSCNLCEEDDSRRATILRYDLDGTFDKVIAEGLRNSVGFEFRSTSEFETEIWSVDNGRDLLGDDLPPEELNVIRYNRYENGEVPHYGWPYCYGQGIANPEYTEETEFCRNQTHFPLYEMQAHSAPLGLSFHPFAENGDSVRQFPDELNHNVFIAFHGSWNRTIPTGYKIVRIDTNNYFREPAHFVDDISNTTLQDKPVNFITGWLDNKGDVWGRPVGVEFDNEGSMYISDDLAGAVYKVIYKK